MKKNRVFLRGPTPRTLGRAVVPTKPWPCATCVTVKSAVTALSHPKRSPPPKEAASTLVNVPGTGARLWRPAVVEEAVELGLDKCLKLNGNVVNAARTALRSSCP